MLRPRGLRAALAALSYGGAGRTLLAGAATASPGTAPAAESPPSRQGSAGGRQQGGRLLHRMGRLRAQLPRQEHRDQRLGRQARPTSTTPSATSPAASAPSATPTPTTTRPTTRRAASTARPTPGTPARCAATSTSCASSRSMHPDLKVLWSFGGWTWSGGFGRGGQRTPRRSPSPATTWSRTRAGPDVFDGIDIDWEYPNACGLTCDTSGPDAFKNVMAALRAKFGRELPGHRGDHGRRHLRRQDRRRRLRAARRSTSTGTTR